MSILVTGGTGKTGLTLAKILLENKKSFLLASRSGTAPEPFSGKGVKFDWLDATTYENPFKADPNIDRMYIINPVIDEPYEPVTAFIDFAKAKGVKRFILLLGSPYPKGYMSHGKIWDHIADLGVEYTVLSPTWFMGTFHSLLFVLQARALKFIYGRKFCYNDSAHHQWYECYYYCGKGWTCPLRICYRCRPSSV